MNTRLQLSSSNHLIDLELFNKIGCKTTFQSRFYLASQNEKLLIIKLNVLERLIRFLGCYESTKMDALIPTAQKYQFSKVDFQSFQNEKTKKFLNQLFKDENKKNIQIEYQNFSKREMGYLADSYLIYGNSHWICLLKKPLNGIYEFEISQDIKVHISIERDPRNVEKSFYVIFPILVKYKISLFKIIPLQNVFSFKPGCNQLGKEFVIYLQTHDKNSQESDLNFWQTVVFPEILDGLLKNDVEAGRPSKGDIQILGNQGFFYSRASMNCFDRYVTADFLEYHGFTREESATLTPSVFIDVQKSQPILFESTTFASQEMTEYFFAEIRKCMLPGKYNQTPALFNMIGGEKTTIIGSKEISAIYLTEIYQLDSDFDWNDRKGKWQIAENFLIKELKRAAEILAATVIDHLSEKIAWKFRAGNILPAIYHHFLFPSVARYKAGKITREQIVSHPFANKEEEDAFVFAVVECGLRKKTSHIFNSKPAYQFELKLPYQSL